MALRITPIMIQQALFPAFEHLCEDLAEQIARGTDGGRKITEAEAHEINLRAWDQMTPAIRRVLRHNTKGG